ncbi:MAG: hypothetical protein QNL70_12955 [Pseudomonas sp.]
MTPEDRSAVRAGCNLATLPADAQAVLQQELKDTGQRHQEIQRTAAQLYGLRRHRLRVERELAQLGDMGPAVKAALNRLISGSDHGTEK